MWWKVTVWGKEAEFCLRNVRKGDVVMVSGEPYEYVFSKDGQEVRQNCIDAKVFKKIGKKGVGWSKKRHFTEKLQIKKWRGDAITLYL